ncbi:MAG: hypothetical protein QOJ13_41 [Gaiellales bacterium]|jgi:hypothetical protein|nr:hypothetical protein [Gaiellales bacterium]
MSDPGVIFYARVASGHVFGPFASAPLAHKVGRRWGKTTVVVVIRHSGDHPI